MDLESEMSKPNQLLSWRALKTKMPNQFKLVEYISSLTLKSQWIGLVKLEWLDHEDFANTYHTILYKNTNILYFHDFVNIHF